MPLQALRTVSKAQNGVGAFILQCRRLDLHYCDNSGSSRGMRALLTSPALANFCASNPQIEITVSPRPGKHPLIRGTYVNGREKAVCVRGLEANAVLEKCNLVKTGSGEKLKRVRGPVQAIMSQGEGVRGGWSGVHGRHSLLDKV